MLEKISPNVGYVVGVGALVFGAAAVSVGVAGILPKEIPVQQTDPTALQVLKSG